MIRAAALLALLLLPAQDAASDFLRLLEAAEKAPFSIPELPEAVARLDALARPALPREMIHRHQSLKAQAVVLVSLHARLTKMKGETVDMPLPGGKTVTVKISEVSKADVEVKRPGGVQAIRFDELDPEWAVSLARVEFASGPDASLWAGLWLARAARWDAAYKDLQLSTSNHPLVLEAQSRGFAGLLKQLDAAIASKKWKEASERLAVAEKTAGSAPVVVKAREELVQAVADQAKEHCRKGEKKAMEELIGFIAKRFPGREAVIAEIREETRWIPVTDPMKFGLMGKDGEPMVLDPVAKNVQGLYVQGVPGTFDGVSVRIRFTEDTKETHAGPLWTSTGGRMTPYVVRNLSLLRLMRLDEAAKKWASLDGGKVEPAETYTIKAVLEGGDLVVSVNGTIVIKWDATGETEIAGPGMQASLGRIKFDRYRLRKKQ